MIYDISPLLHHRIAVWEGDTPFRMKRLMAFERGDEMNLGSIELSLHTGAHADAPSHFLAEGPPIDELALEDYLGPARVITRTGRGAIEAFELVSVLEEPAERLLIRTCPERHPEVLPEDFRYLTAEAAARVVEAGVRLVGLDSPSVDAFESVELPAHKALARGEVRILENLLLNHVEDGDYELIALPLRISGGDGSPVRAVLRTLGR